MARENPVQGAELQGDTRSLGGQAGEGVVRATLADQTGQGLVAKSKARGCAGCDEHDRPPRSEVTCDQPNQSACDSARDRSHETVMTGGAVRSNPHGHPQCATARPRQAIGLSFDEVSSVDNLVDLDKKASVQ